MVTHSLLDPSKAERNTMIANSYLQFHPVRGEAGILYGFKCNDDV